MEEERQLVPDAAITQNLAHAHKVIVVNPDQIRGRGALVNDAGELVLDGLIGCPVLGHEVAPGLQAMKERPDDLVAEAMVEALVVLAAHGHGAHLIPVVPAKSFKVCCSSVLSGQVSPGQPIHIPPQRLSSGTKAVTSPPETVRVDRAPGDEGSMMIGNRLEDAQCRSPYALNNPLITSGVPPDDLPTIVEPV